MTTSYRDWFLDVVTDDARWIEFLDQHGPVLAAAELKRLRRSLGEEEVERNNILRAAADSPHVTDRRLAAMRQDHKAWLRGVAKRREQINDRLRYVQASAQALIDAHQSDRRALVVLAKRIWLWEEGREDRLEEALDDFTISDSCDSTRRKTLRDLIEEMLASGTEITP